MKVVITGGTGFLGQALARRLVADQHEVVVLTRGSHSPSTGRSVNWNPNGSTGAWQSEIDGAGAVVNLAGESIAGRRWTDQQKQKIHDSRVLATQSLVEAVRAAKRPPAVLVSGSAVGYYGPLGDEPVTETHPPGSDFLARVCIDWEREAGKAAGATRVVCIRTGLVLERDGGALPKMLPPFWFGAGGPVGSGRQYWPWIHRKDWIEMVLWAIQTRDVSGAINASAPSPVTNAVFAKALGRALHRPAILPTPGFALKIMLGEMADALLLSGQRVIPEKPGRLGFRFTFDQLDDALRAIFQRQ